jgi:PAS domain S-box-containing protein
LACVAFRCRADADWSIESVSEGYRALASELGRERLPSVPLTYSNFITRCAADRIRAAAHQRVDSGRPFVMRYAILVEGRRQWVIERTRGLHDDQGRLVSVVGVLIDFSELLTGGDIPEAQHFLNPLIEHAPFPLYMISPDDRVRIANPVFDWFVGHPEGSVGQTLDSLFSPTMADIFREQNQRVLKLRSPLVFKEEVEAPKGGIRHFHTVKFPVWDALEERYAVGGVSVEITPLVETARALELSRQGFELLANTIPQVVWSTDENGALDYCNDSMLQLCGRPREQVMGSDWLPLVQPEQRPEVARAWRGALETGTAFERTCLLGSPDAGYRWHLVRARRLGQPRQTGTRWFGTCTDIDERHQAEDTLRFLAESGRRLLDSALDIDALLAILSGLLVPRRADGCLLLLKGPTFSPHRVVVAHREPRRQAAAEALRVALHASHERAGLWSRGRGTLREELLSPVTPTLLAERVPEEDMRRLHEELDIRTALVLPLVVRDRGLGVMMLFRSGDFRPFTQVERTAGRELSHTVALLCDYSALHEAMREAVAARDDFISIAAHELRTPLTGLTLRHRQLARLLAAPDKTGPRRDEAALRVLNACEEQARRLARLVDQLLDTTHLRSGRMVLEREEVDLGALVHGVMDRLGAELTRAGCEVAFEEHDPVRGLWDRSRLEQVVTNLMSNAMKYGAGGPITLRLELSLAGTHARLSIRDRGIGITPQLQQAIFERFERGVSSRKYGGLGLGLYICRQIIEAHGGHIGVQSEPGAGSEFQVELPLRPPPGPGPAA